MPVIADLQIRQLDQVIHTYILNSKCILQYQKHKIVGFGLAVLKLQLKLTIPLQQESSPVLRVPPCLLKGLSLKRFDSAMSMNIFWADESPVRKNPGSLKQCSPIGARSTSVYYTSSVQIWIWKCSLGFVSDCSMFTRNTKMNWEWGKNDYSSHWRKPFTPLQRLSGSWPSVRLSVQRGHSNAAWGFWK